MARDREIALHCKINAGGFSGERVVLVALAEGGERRVLAPRHYCWTEDGQPLSEYQPALGSTIRGLVAARRIHDLPDGSVAVTTPDGEVFAVASGTVKPRPATPEISPNVPVRP